MVIIVIGTSRHEPVHRWFRNTQTKVNPGKSARVCRSVWATSSVDANMASHSARFSVNAFPPSSARVRPDCRVIGDSSNRVIGQGLAGLCCLQESD